MLVDESLQTVTLTTCQEETVNTAFPHRHQDAVVFVLGLVTRLPSSTLTTRDETDRSNASQSIHVCIGLFRSSIGFGCDSQRKVVREVSALHMAADRSISMQ